MRALLGGAIRTTLRQDAGVVKFETPKRAARHSQNYGVHAYVLDRERLRSPARAGDVSLYFERTRWRSVP